MTEMIERVAKAICRAEGWDEEDIWPDCIAAARLAIEALLEPTDEMVQAGWRAMIARAGAGERDDNVITFGKQRKTPAEFRRLPDTAAGLIEAAEQARDLLNGRVIVGSDAYKAFCILNAAISRARAADRSIK